MESLFSFPVGLLHPLQHAGLSRRTPDCRPSGSYRAVFLWRIKLTSFCSSVLYARFALLLSVDCGAADISRVSHLESRQDIWIILFGPKR
jgi:hypothetical protein